MKQIVIVALALLAGSSAGMAGSMPQKVNRIYSYDCTYQFIESESLRDNVMSCEDGSHIGLYRAKYRYYLYANDDYSSFPLKGTHAMYSSGICGLNLARYSCEDSTPREAFALSAQREGRFNIAVSLPMVPEQGTQLVGFAAPLNPQGECDEGLTKIRPYYAYPPSILYPLPTNFRNADGRWNGYQVATAEKASQNFDITHVQASGECKDGLCPMPSGEETLSVRVPFVAARPVVCALPLQQ